MNFIAKFCGALLACIFTCHSAFASDSITTRSEVYDACKITISFWEHTLETQHSKPIYVSNIHYQTRGYIYNYVTTSSGGVTTNYAVGHKNLPEVFSSAKKAYKCETKNNLVKSVPACGRILAESEKSALATCIFDAFSGLGRSSTVKKEIFFP